MQMGTIWEMLGRNLLGKWQKMNRGFSQQGNACDFPYLEGASLTVV